MSRSRPLEDNHANANADPHPVLPPPGTVPGDDGTFMHPRLPRTPIRNAPALIPKKKPRFEHPHSTSSRPGHLVIFGVISVATSRSRNGGGASRPCC
ncbi:uncharacterized protein PAN0_021d6049 [Moesziomyces antarcticus]|uniref:Uncharacterized protein n=1 Tax=Pseudozyma antarctica TaxID=84753 RepID=A0A081CMC4_PSEA2|nr:uncharacterized protein PAN0_021d6049 [Moesziomyces antarcticus]GAK67820.1 hypothetical protein PAN0_021d6049 [Moesziomyces antarcticus]